MDRVRRAVIRVEYRLTTRRRSRLTDFDIADRNILAVVPCARFQKSPDSRKKVHHILPPEVERIGEVEAGPCSLRIAYRSRSEFQIRQRAGTERCQPGARGTDQNLILQLEISPVSG